MNETRSGQGGAFVIGALLVVAGIFFLIVQQLEIELAWFQWPLWIVVAGIVLFALAFVPRGESGTALAIFGAMTTVAGLLLYYQNATGHWESWAYAWALVAPGSIGFGLLLYGLLTADVRLVRSGTTVSTIGLGLFLVGALFFEGLLGIGGRPFGQYTEALLAAGLIALGVLLVIGALVPRGRWAGPPPGYWGPPPPGRIPPPPSAGAGPPAGSWPGSEAQQLALDLGSANRADVQLDFGAGRLAVGPASSGRLLEGSFEGGVRHEATPDGRVRLWMEAPWFDWGWRRHDWRVGLTKEVPLRLRVNTGAAETELDLTELRVGELQLKTGASETRVLLPRAAGSTRVDVEGGAASIRFRVPQGVAARIRSTMALGSTDVDPRRFPPAGPGYASPDFETAANRVDIEFRGGVGSLSVM